MIPSTALPSELAQAARCPRVLVADDSRVIRLAINKILGATFDVVQVENGIHAWEHLCRDPAVQAVVTDIEMPELDGYALIRRIRAAADARLQKLPVIAITGAEDDVSRQRAFASGATDFITKPIDAIQLQARVQAYVRYDQAARELSEKSTALEGQVITDPLTRLHSRRYLMRRGEQDVAFALRRDKDLTLICLAIDGFKKLYQSHGDETCDRLLVWLAKQLVANARAEDTVARVAGAEFVIMANATSVEEAAAICERLRDAIASQPYCEGSVTIPITLSFGMASIGQDPHDSVDALLRLAEQRLSRAQTEGADRLCSGVTATAAMEQSAPAAVTPVAPAPVIEDTVRAVSVPDPEARVGDDSDETVAQVMARPVQSPQQDGQASTSSEVLTVDRALQLLAEGRNDALIPHLEGLVRRVKPLMDLYVQACRGMRRRTE